MECPRAWEFRLISSANYDDLKVTTKIENVEPPPSAGSRAGEGAGATFSYKGRGDRSTGT